MLQPDPERSWVILIGTSHYQDAVLPDLPGVKGNVTDLAEVLTRPGSGLFAPGNCIQYLEPANASELGVAMSKIANLAEDTLFIYYAGHGLLDDDGALHLGLSSTDVSHTEFSAMPLATINRIFRRSPAKHHVLILDCCFSGRAVEAMAEPGSVVFGQIDMPGRFTLTSSAANELSNAPVGARHTSFTGELLSLLDAGRSDGPELLTLGQIYGHLLRALNARGLPKPHRGSGGTVDDVALARNVAWAADRYAEFPPEVARVLRASLPRDREAGVETLVGLIKEERASAQAAREALTILSDDDSRMVANSATAALAAFHSVSGVSVQQRGSMPDEIQVLNKMACGRPLNYLDSALGAPLLEGLLRDDLPERMYRVYRTEDMIVIVTAAGTHKPVDAFSITMRHSKFPVRTGPLTADLLDVDLAQATFGSVDETPEGVRLIIGANRIGYTESFYFGNPGHYQTFLLSYNDAAAGDFHYVEGRHEFSSGSLVITPRDGELADAPRGSWYPEFRSGTRINTLTVVSTAAPVVALLTGHSFGIDRSEVDHIPD
ncbi:caspase family protein [Amycolatopsis nalaikhensis]|uniref:Caspase family protein n=1 Tax=Amycolatopsis nalaikhensis TaxID=715472 RepID=A0ABY8XYC4_9PSEU|nr:ETEC_3214 domain-containing protein [Amycolatopsis sp. 2-2]WIV60613.1 caspase family protein [Amycolatopsis sp. 2-2]